MPTPSDRGLFVWHELNTTDIGSAEGFYSKLIGWKTTAWDQNPAYRIWTMGREGRGGLYSVHEERTAVPPPPHWLSYIGTADVDATVRHAVELGGKVATPAYDVPRVGRMAVLNDPQGAMFAISARIERLPYRDPQFGDFSWHELLTTNWQTAFDFYSKLFGWEKMGAMDMSPQGTYQIYGTGGHQLGGMFTPGGLPPTGPQWVPYIMVRDARKSAELVKELGAAVLQEPAEVPGGDCVFTGIDRQGAMFAVHSKKRATPTATMKDTKSTKTTKKNKRSGRARLSPSRKASANRRSLGEGGQSRRPTKKKTARKRR
jgi:uncharacterized protein